MIRNVMLAKLESKYDADEPRNALPTRLAPFFEQVARAQFELPG